jgi:hypothetical protein
MKMDLCIENITDRVRIEFASGQRPHLQFWRRRQQVAHVVQSPSTTPRAFDSLRAPS